MTYPKIQVGIASFFLLLSISLFGCGSGGSSAGLFGRNVDCSIGGTTEDPGTLTQFQAVDFQITGIPSRSSTFLRITPVASDSIPPLMFVDFEGNVTGAPIRTGIQTFYVYAADDDNTECFTMFEIDTFVDECDLGVSPSTDDGTPAEITTELGATLDEDIEVDLTFEDITIIFEYRIFNSMGVEVLPDGSGIIEDFPAPGLTLDTSVLTGVSSLPNLKIEGPVTFTGTFTFRLDILTVADPSSVGDSEEECTLSQTFALIVEVPEED